MNGSSRPPGQTGSRDLHSPRVQAADEKASAKAIQKLIEHRRSKRGKLFGIAGLPRHGKTTLADRLRERAADRPGTDLRYNKTERGEVNIYYLPGRRDHHVLVDMSGEDYRVLGDYERELPELMTAFLWPILKRLDGMALLMALPVVWAGWNRADQPGWHTPDDKDEYEMEQETKRMVGAHQMLLKYAIVARFEERLRRKRFLTSRRDQPPDREEVDNACKCAPKYDRPVAVVLSKADLYAVGDRDRLHTPNLPRRQHRRPPGIVPGKSDPLMTGATHFPDFLDFLEGHARYFKWSFCQALKDPSPDRTRRRRPATRSPAPPLWSAARALWTFWLGIRGRCLACHRLRRFGWTGVCYGGGETSSVEGVGDVKGWGTDVWFDGRSWLERGRAAPRLHGRRFGCWRWRASW